MGDSMNPAKAHADLRWHWGFAWFGIEVGRAWNEPALSHMFAMEVIAIEAQL